jgi:hypothetical protein
MVSIQRLNIHADTRVSKRSAPASISIMNFAQPKCSITRAFASTVLSPLISAPGVKEIAFALCVRGGNTKKRRSTTRSGIPFRHLTQFQLNNLLRQQGTTTEDVASSTEYRPARYVGSSSRDSQNRLALEASLMLLLGRSVLLPFA